MCRRLLLFMLSVILMTETVYAAPLETPISSIEVTSQPKRLVYDIGEDVDLYGISLSVKYIDGYTESVGYEDLTVSNYNPMQLGSQLILVHYGDYSTPISVTVRKGVLKSITVKLTDNNRKWVEGDKVDRSMLKVYAEYDLGNQQEVKDFTYEPKVLTDGRNSIEVQYNGLTTQTIVDARKNECVNIRVENPGTSLFCVGQAFNWNGLKVIGHYTNNSEVDVTSKCTVSGVNTAYKGTFYAEVKFEDKIVTYPVEVIELNVDHIDTNMWKDEHVVRIHFKDMAAPVEIGADSVSVSDDNVSGCRTFTVQYMGNIYTTTAEIPAEERRYVRSNRICVQVPIRVNLVANDAGVLGYMSKTSLQSMSECDVQLTVKNIEGLNILHGLPATLRFGKKSTLILPLDLDSVPWNGNKTYHMDSVIGAK